MKVLCPHCERLVDLERYRLDGATLVVTCQRCGADSRVGQQHEAAVAASPSPSPAVTSSPSRPPSQPPRVSLASSPGASNVVMLRTSNTDAIEKAAKAAGEAPFAVPEGVCPKCLAKRADAPACAQCGLDFARFDPASVAPPQWLADGWVEALRDWGNAAKHEGLQNRAQQLDALAALGRLYRLRLAWTPDDPIAEKGRADVLRVASLQTSFRPPPNDKAVARVKLISALIIIVLCGIAVVGLVRMMLTRQ